MKRGLWFLAGAGAGVYAMVRGRRVAEAFTADGLHDRWEALALGARMFRDEVAQGQAEAETDLRERFGLVPHGHRELAAPAGSMVSTSATDDRSAPGPVDSTGPTDERGQEGTH